MCDRFHERTRIVVSIFHSVIVHLFTCLQGSETTGGFGGSVWPPNYFPGHLLNLRKTGRKKSRKPSGRIIPLQPIYWTKTASSACENIHILTLNFKNVPGDMPTDSNTGKGQYRSSPAPTQTCTSWNPWLCLCLPAHGQFVFAMVSAKFLLLHIGITNSHLRSLIAVV